MKKETIKEQSNSVVSIEDAAVAHANNFYTKGGEDIWGEYTEGDLWQNRKSNFIEGAKFRDEQYSSLLSSYRELLQCIEEIKGECDGHGVINQTWLLNKCQSALNNGDNILSQFKQ